MSFHEHTSVAPFVSLVNSILSDSERMWGIATIKRAYLRPITNEAFSLAMRNEMRDADESHIAYIDSERIDIAWCGKQKAVFRQIFTYIETSLLRSGLGSGAGVAVSYTDPKIKGKTFLTALNPDNTLAKDTRREFLTSHFPDDDDEAFTAQVEASGFNANVPPQQAEAYQESSAQKPFRPQLHILVVEDQPFSQKLLCEILRSARLRNSKETPIIDAVLGINDAWKLFLKKVPDMIFVDLCLADGSGHTLAAAIKSFDPTAHVIIVTANNYEEELSVARQNNVDGFIVKPYNKKQILDCVDRYISLSRPSSSTRALLR